MGAGKRIRRTIIKPEDMGTRRSEDLETVWGDLLRLRQLRAPRQLIASCRQAPLQH